MRAEAGVPLAALHGDGGPTASRFLMQLTADLAGTELRVATMPDCSPLGAVFAGQLGLGLRRSLTKPGGAPRSDMVYRPTLPPDRTATLYAGWQAAVRQVLAP